MIYISDLPKWLCYIVLFASVAFPAKGQSLNNTEIRDITTQIGTLISSHYVITAERQKIVDQFQLKIKVANTSAFITRIAWHRCFRGTYVPSVTISICMYGI